MTIETQAAYLTEALRACRRARETGKENDLAAAATWSHGEAFDALPDPVKDEIRDAYSMAAAKVFGIGGG